MNHRIHIFGASGSGTSTLGAALARRINGRHLDTDDYYWAETDPPYTEKNEPAQRVAMIQKDVEGLDSWVLSGSICSWGDPLLDSFSLAVFVQLDPTIRMQRLRDREVLRHGDRIQPSGDMRQQHLDFIDWAASYDTAKAPIRSLDLHHRWMKGLNCPILEVNSADPVTALCDQVLA